MAAMKFCETCEQVYDHLGRHPKGAIPTYGLPREECRWCKTAKKKADKRAAADPGPDQKTPETMKKKKRGRPKKQRREAPVEVTTQETQDPSKKELEAQEVSGEQKKGSRELLNDEKLIREDLYRFMTKKVGYPRVDIVFLNGKFHAVNLPQTEQPLDRSEWELLGAIAEKIKELEGRYEQAT